MAQVSKCHQLSVLNKIAKCKIGYYTEGEICSIHIFFGRTGHAVYLDPGNRFASVPQPTQQGLDIHPDKRVGQRSKGVGACVLEGLVWLFTVVSGTNYILSSVKTDSTLHIVEPKRL